MTRAMAHGLINCLQLLRLEIAVSPSRLLNHQPLNFVPNEDQAASSTDLTSESEPESKPGRLFVPVKESKRRCKDDPVCEAVKLMKSVIENDPTKEIMNFIREDLQKTCQHELILLQMMLSHGNWQQSPHGFHAPTASHNNYFQPEAFSTPLGNQHSHQDLYQEYLFQPVSSARSRPPSAQSNASSSSSSSTHDVPFYHSM